MASRLRERYESEIRPALIERFGYSTPMQAPRVLKVTVNMGVAALAVTSTVAVARGIAAARTVRAATSAETIATAEAIAATVFAGTARSTIAARTEAPSAIPSAWAATAIACARRRSLARVYSKH